MVRAPSGYETRLRNVKQAEYEVLKTILTDEVIQERVNARLLLCAPKKGKEHDPVCVRRAQKAQANLSSILNSMARRRRKFLPSMHIDFEGDE